MLNNLRESLKPYLQNIGRAFASTGISPNVWTVVGLVFAFTASLIYGINVEYSLILGGIILLVSGFFDIVDGQVARYTNKISKTGGFLDSVFDKIAEVAIFFGILMFCVLIIIGSFWGAGDYVYRSGTKVFCGVHPAPFSGASPRFFGIYEVKFGVSKMMPNLDGEATSDGRDRRIPVDELWVLLRRLGEKIQAQVTTLRVDLIITQTMGRKALMRRHPIPEQPPLDVQQIPFKLA